MKNENMLTDKFLAEEFNVQPRLIRWAIENIMINYGIDSGLVLKNKLKSGEKRWLIDRSLITEIAREISIDTRMVITATYSYGGKKPSLDYYDNLDYFNQNYK